MATVLKPIFTAYCTPRWPKSAQTQHRDDIAGSRRAVAQRIVSRDARAHQRRGFHGRQIVRHQRHRDGRRHHVIRVTAVKRNAGDLQRSPCRQKNRRCGNYRTCRNARRASPRPPAGPVSIASRPRPRHPPVPTTSWPGTRGYWMPGQCPSFTMNRCGKCRRPAP